MCTARNKCWNIRVIRLIRLHTDVNFRGEIAAPYAVDVDADPENSDVKQYPVDAGQIQNTPQGLLRGWYNCCTGKGMPAKLKNLQ